MSLITNDLVKFEEYEIHRARWQLSWRDEPLQLNRKTFDLLLYLIDHRERVVGKDELLQALWPEQFIEESNLTQHIFLLRKALSRHESGTKIIETVPGRGYRFAAVVKEQLPTTDRMVIRSTESITRITLEEEETDTVGPALRGYKSGLLRSPLSRKWLISRIAGATVAAVALCMAGWSARQRWFDRSGGAPVQIVLVPLEGTTGDAVLDLSLTQAFRMDLAQSPYVTVVPSSTVRATLTQMMHKPDDTMTPAMAREVCERTNSQGVLSGTIAKFGQHFLITEEATNCLDGAVLGQARREAATAEDLPRAIDKISASLRKALGESRSSLARFNMPLFQQNTPSLEALKAFTQGTQLIREGKFPEAIGLLQTAVKDDPKFAAAYYNLAAAYGSAGDDLHVRDAIAKAYSLKDTTSRSTQFGIETMYDSEYTGDMYELVRHFQSWVDLYPNSSQAWSGLANAQRDLSMDAEALASQKRTVELLPHSQGMLANLAMDQMRAGDLEGARATCERAIRDNLDGDGLRIRYLHLAYLLHDASLLQAQREWFATHPQASGLLRVEAQIAMAEGRFRDVHKLLARIRDLHRQQGLSGADDEQAKFGAVDLMQIGDLEAGKNIFQQSPVDIEDGQEVLGLVYVGDISAAQAGLLANQAKYPQATMWKLFWGPRINAAIAMAQHRPAEAAALLEVTRPFDKSGRFLPWLRANAYLAAGQPALAEKEYRSMISHPEFDPTSPCIPLSWLGLARSLRDEGNRSGAIDAYQHFLGLWAHADSDAAPLKQAKLELARMVPDPSAASSIQ